MEHRKLGRTDVQAPAVMMGCWPIAGMTSVGVTDAESLATLQAALDAGVNGFDTAYCYGAEGESERLIARALKHRRTEIVIATKGGIHWGPDGKQVLDGRPATLERQCDESLRRLGTDHVELLYLHAPDPTLPIEESAGALKKLLDAGKTRSVGLSNASVEQLEDFARVCPLAAYQPHYNLLQREIETSQLPWCRANGVSVMVYWPLMKGFLAGKLHRDHIWDPKDGRGKYPMFQGEEWRKNQDFLDRLRPIAASAGKTLAQLAVNWVIRQPGITSALCGAKRPPQIVECAGAADWSLDPVQLAHLEAALHERGVPYSRSAV